VSPSALVALLEQRVPGSAELLSAVDAGETTDHAAREIAQDSVRRLKEFALERRIAQGKSRLKNSESFKESSDYDELFREVSELQRALDRLRRAAGDMS
jgi:polyhydroxyalkanoate synthesis regulator phasin